MSKGVVFAIGTFVAGMALAEVAISLSSHDVLLAKESLQAFDEGKAGLEELSEGTGRTGRQKLIAYYLTDTNTVSLKGKLLVSRCFAIDKRFPQAALLAEEYLHVYSNDWRGWRILGGARFASSNWNDAVRAYTNAVILGDEACYTPLVGAAIQADRLDLIRDIVPHLLILKEAQRTDENTKLEIVMGLALYAFKADQEAVFVKALEGMTAEKLLSRRDVAMAVRWGCEKFTTPEAQLICKKLQEANDSRPKAKKE